MWVLVLFFYGYVDHRDLHVLTHSFPTRRSSDLAVAAACVVPQARFDDDPLNLRDPESPSVAALLALLDDPRVSPYSAQLLVEDEAAAAALAPRLEALPEVEAVISLADLVPQDQDAKDRKSTRLNSSH